MVNSKNSDAHKNVFWLVNSLGGLECKNCVTKDIY